MRVRKGLRGMVKMKDSIPKVVRNTKGEREEGRVTENKVRK